MWSILPFFIKHIITAMIIKGESLRSSPRTSVSIQMHTVLLTAHRTSPCQPVLQNKWHSNHIHYFLIKLHNFYYHCMLCLLFVQGKIISIPARFTLDFSTEAGQFCLAPVGFEQVSVTVNTMRWEEKGGWKKPKSFTYVSLFTHTRCELKLHLESNLTVKGTFFS